MEQPMETYWEKRLGDLKRTLEKNNFEVFMARDTGEARAIVENDILPEIKPKTVSWGGSMTFVATGLYHFFRDSPRYEVIDTFDRSIPREEMMERRRRALLVDLFLTGTNAVTEAGHLVNLDMQGNRVAAITHGPRHVVLLVGRNKLVRDLGEAMYRVKNYAAPVNTMRLGMKTPCAETGRCQDCAGPDRICNSWVITEKSWPKGRTRIVLINQDLGF
jgi:L-lactate utilization protein LutB